MKKLSAACSSSTPPQDIQVQSEKIELVINFQKYLNAPLEQLDVGRHVLRARHSTA